MSWGFNRAQARYDSATPEDRFDIFGEDDEREEDLDQDEAWHG